MTIYAQTNEALKDDDDDEDDVLRGMPPLDGSDEEAPHTDGENPDVGEVSPDEKDDGGGDALSVIATPGPVTEPNTDDRAFIKRPSESDSGPETEDQLYDDEDPEYVPDDDAGTDGDDEEDGGEPRRQYVSVATAKAEAERAARAAYNAALQEARAQQEQMRRLAQEAADQRFAEHLSKM